MSDILKYGSLIRLAHLDADPISTENGALYYNTVDNVVKQYMDGAWQVIPTQQALNLLDGRVTTVEGNISTLQSDVSSLDGRVTTVEGDVSTLQSDVSSLDGRVTTAEGNISTLQGDVTSLGGRMTTAEGNISTLQSDVSSLGGRMTTAEGNISTLQGDVSSLDGRVTANEGDISTLQSDLSDLDAYAQDIRSDLDTLDGEVIKKDGSVAFTADQSMGNNQLTNVADPLSAQDAATKSYVDSADGALNSRLTTAEGNISTLQGDVSTIQSNYIKKDGSVAFTGDQSMGSHKITNLLDPTSAQDAATKSYVDGISISVENIRYVSKNGSDVTGNGSVNKPYLTITAAQNSITDASPTKRYGIVVSAGSYTESGVFGLKANVFIVGTSRDSVRIGATSFALASDFSGSADNRSGISQAILLNNADFNWATVTSAAGKLYFNEVSFSGTVNLYGHNNNIAQAQFDSCAIFGNFTISGINLGVHTNNTHYGNITMTQHPNGGMVTTIVAAGGSCAGTMTLNATVNDFNRRCSLFARNFWMNGLTINGVSAYADATISSIPKNGATITNSGNLVYIDAGANNKLSNLVGPTAVNTSIVPASENSVYSGDFGKQWFFNFAYVYASSGTDMYLTTYASSYTPDSVGRSIYISPDGAGLLSNVNSGEISLETSATSGTGNSGNITLKTGVPGGTGTRGEVLIDASQLDMNSKKIVNVLDPTAAQDAATKNYVDNAVTGGVAGFIKADGSVAFSADQSMGGNQLTNVGEPALSTDAATKNYVDTTAVLLSQKDVANGVAGLDNNGHILASALPNSVMEFKGQWNASTNSPSLSDGSGNPGDVYECTTAGSVDFGSGSITFAIGDWAVYGSNGLWFKSINSNAVTSVNSQTGTVVLDSDDVSEGSLNLYFTNTRAENAIAAQGIYLKKDGSVSLEADLSMGGNQLTNVGSPSANDDAATKLYVDSAVAGLTNVIKADGTVTFTADQSMGNHKLTNLAAPVSTNDAARKADVDAVQTQVTSLQGNVSTLQSDVSALQGDVSTLQGDVSTLQSDLSDLDSYAQDIRSDLDTLDGQVIKKDGSVAFTANQSMGTHKLTDVVDPTAAQDAATKNYVDNAVSGGVSGVIKADGSVAFTANQSMGNHKLTNVTDPTLAQDAATKNYVDAADGILQGQINTINSDISTIEGDISTIQGNISSLQGDLSTLDGLAIKKDGSVVYTADQSMGSHKLTNLSNGTNPADAVNKSQLDTKYDIPAGTTSQYVRGDGSLATFPTSIESASKLTTLVFNKTGVTIPKFSVVYINGGQGDMPTITLAQGNNEANSTKTYGVTTADILNMQSGTVVATGALTGVNTDQFNPTAPVGDVNGVALWLSPTTPGGLTTTKPVAPNHMVFVGTIIKTHQTQGVVEIKIQNGFELEELHNVSITSITNNQVLMYDSVTSLWKNHALTKSDVGLSNVDNTSDLNKPISTATQSALDDLDAAMIKKDGSVAFTGDQSMGGHDLTNAAIVQTTEIKIGADELVISQSGTGVGAYFSFDGKRLNSSAVPSDVHDLTNKTYVDSADTTLQNNINTLDGLVIKKDGSVAFTGNQSLDGHKLTNVLDPSAAQDAATKNYVDTTTIPFSEKGAPNGVATLDGSGKVTASQLPAGALVIKGDWSAATNTPLLADGVGSVGDTWVCNAAGTVNLGSGNITFAVGDWAVYTSSNVWIKVVNSSAVASVNSQTGAVVLNSDDISEGLVNLYFTDARAVSAVLASDSFIEKDGSVSFTGDQSMGNHKLTNLAAPTDSNDAARKTDVDAVQSQVTTLQSDVSDLQNDMTQAQIDISGLQSDVSTIQGDYIHKDGSVAFTAAQSMGSNNLTDVADPVNDQDAATKKYVTDNTVASVNGQNGVVTLDTDDINEGALNQYFTDTRARDAVGNILLDGATIDFTYLDGVPSISAEVKDNSITNIKIADDAVDGNKIRLDNNESLRARNAADSADINVLKVNTLNLVELQTQLIPTGASGSMDLGSASANFNVVHSTEFVSDGVVARFHPVDKTDANTSSVFFRGGDITGTTAARSSGQAVIRSGDISGAASGCSSGAITVRSGNISSGGGNSGSLTLQSGTSISGNTGAVVLSSGNATSGNSGNVTIQSGTASGTRGTVSLNASTVNLNSAVGGLIDGNSKVISNVADPLVAQDVATKAYVDANAGGLSPGDIKETSFSGLVNNTADQVITGFAFNNAVARSFKASVSVVIDAATDQFVVYELMGIQRGSDWKMSQNFTGDTIEGLSFSITNAGQVQVSIGNISGFSSGLIKFRAITTSV